jgi:YHS domain-containing protein
MSKTLSFAALALIAAISVTPAWAADEHNTVPGLTAAGAPLGLHGVDPVAFIDIGNRIEGTAEFTAVHDGVAYYFATEDNLDAFEDDPERYIPQNGGFCTYGVSVGKKFDGDPRYAAVNNGKLYVFLNEEVFHLFQEDRAGTIATAEENWEEIQHIAASEL